LNGDRNWAVGIRGFGDQFSKSVLVLIDGRSVYTPLFAGVLWTINNVMIEDVDRIEVIRGPGGTIWGANAENGVINIITKSSADTHGSLVVLGGGNVDQGTTSLRYGGGNGKGFNYRVYGTGFIRGPEFHADNINYDNSRLGQVGFRTDWEHQSSTFTLQGDTYRGEFGDAQLLSTFSPPASFISFASMDAYGGNLLGRWRKTLSEGSDLYLQAFWAHDFRIGSNFGETRDTFDVDFLHRFLLPVRQQFTYGFEARISPSTYKEVLPTDDFEPHDKTSSIYSVFLQDEFTLVPDTLSLTLGSKLEHNNYTGFEYQPNGRLLWTPSKKQSFWTAITRAVRIPSRIDEDPDVSVVLPGPPEIVAEVIGSHALDSERLISYEAGYRSLINPALYFDISLFYNDYNNIVAQTGPVISVAPTPAPPHVLALFQFQNGIRGFTKGFEIAPDWKPAPWWDLKTGYSYLHLSLSHLPGIIDTTTLPVLQGSSPAHEVFVHSEFDIAKRFEFDPMYRYVSALPAQNVRAYQTADLRLAWNLKHLALS
ncbi:MAG: TonB-dependent receptor plug domain-containing protein, partial [Candidatus Angelobacter sp.]